MARFVRRPRGGGLSEGGKSTGSAKREARAKRHAKRRGRAATWPARDRIDATAPTGCSRLLGRLAASPAEPAVAAPPPPGRRAASGSPRPTGTRRAPEASAGGAVADGLRHRAVGDGARGLRFQGDVAVGAQAHRDAAAGELARDAVSASRLAARLRGREPRHLRAQLPAARLGVEVEAAAVGDLEAHLAAASPTPSPRRPRAARGREARAAALDLDLDRAGEAVERDVASRRAHLSALREAARLDPAVVGDRPAPARPPGRGSRSRASSPRRGRRPRPRR